MRSVTHRYILISTIYFYNTIFSFICGPDILRNSSTKSMVVDSQNAKCNMTKERKLIKCKTTMKKYDKYILFHKNHPKARHSFKLLKQQHSMQARFQRKQTKCQAHIYIPIERRTMVNIPSPSEL